MEEMWLARDKSGCLYLYKGKPIKYSTYWMRPLPKYMIQLDNSLFPKCNGRTLSRLRLNLK